MRIYFSTNATGQVTLPKKYPAASWIYATTTSSRAEDTKMVNDCYGKHTFGRYSQSFEIDPESRPRLTNDG